MKSKEIDISFGSKLREIRAKRDMSQKELAAKMGCSHVEISNYERGITTDIGISRIRKMLAVLNVNSSYFFENVNLNLDTYLKTQECDDVIDSLMKMPDDDREKFVEIAQSHAFAIHHKTFKLTRRA